MPELPQTAMKIKDLSGLERPRLHCIYALVLFTFASAAFASQQVAEVEFNDIFLQQSSGSRIDVSRFDKGNLAAPGTYVADLYVNLTWSGRAQITLAQQDSGGVEPCFDRDLLERAGVDITKLAPQAAALLDHAQASCTTISQLIPDATAVFDNGEQRLDISVPQAAMSRHARGYVDPKYWDDGVSAALLQYNASAYRSQSGGNASTQAYAGITAGVNVGPWRFRHQGNVNTSSQTGTHYQDIQTSLQRSVAPLKSQLVIGDAFTDGAMFDSVGFRGVQLASDDRMYPESQRGYAPVIHGTARTNAHVQVLQNGNVLYETNVAPGPFEIDDLYATGYGGNLDIVVIEADGTRTSSVVPYAPAPNALRPGVTRYSVTAGEYRSAQINAKPLLFQGTVQHGFTNLLTGYGGITIADGYMAAVAGTALNTDFGAFGVDITQANTKLSNEASRSGQSVRVSYSKLIAPTNTNIAVAAYRFSSGGFLSLENAMAMRATGNPSASTYGGTPRNSGQITLNQSLPDGWGSFYLTGTTQDYWNRGGTDTQFQAGYNNVFKRVSYGVSVSRQRDITNNRWDNRVMLTMSVPLGLGAHAPTSTTNIQHDTNGATNVQQTVAGTLLADNSLNYALNTGYNGGGGSASSATGGGSVSWTTPMSTLSGSASVGSGYNQFGAGMSGSVVAYGGGVVTSPATGETMAIVEAKDAEGAWIASRSGLHVDRFGHALVPGLTPFASNEIEIDPKGLPISVELKSTSQRVAPTAGAIVRAKFETDNPGVSAIVRARMTDGRPVPFGAEVRDAQGVSMGTVAQGGQAIVRGLKSQTGILTFAWTDGTRREACHVTYSMPKSANAKATDWTTLDTVCQPGDITTSDAGAAKHADTATQPGGQVQQ